MEFLSAIISFFVISLLKSGQDNILDTVVRPLSEFINTLIPTKKADLISYIKLAHFDFTRFQDYVDNARLHGYNEKESQVIWDSFKERLPLEYYIWALRRGEIFPQEFEPAVKGLGYAKQELRILEAYKIQYPGIQDLIQFAVRECYNPEAVRLLGLDQFYPQEFEEDGKKQGFIETDLHNFWKSHWRIPALREAFEMFQRGAMNEGDLDKVIQYNDYAPGFIPALKQIAYSPLGRVDIRRMYRIGVIKVEDLQSRYQQLGYSPEDSKHLADFTVKYEDEEETGLSRSMITTAYKDGIVDRDRAEELLRIINYPENNIALTLDIADYEIEQKYVAEQVKSIKARVKKGILSYEDGLSELRTLDLPETSRLIIETELVTTIKEKSKVVQLATCYKWMKLLVIDESNFRERATVLGYKTVDIENYILQYKAETMSED